MNAQEKALELYDKFKQYVWHEVDGWLIDHKATKEIAIKVVNEIILSNPCSRVRFKMSTKIKLESNSFYWLNVKRGIENIKE